MARAGDFLRFSIDNSGFLGVLYPWLAGANLYFGCKLAQTNRFVALAEIENAGR